MPLLSGCYASHGLEEPLDGPRLVPVRFVTDEGASIAPTLHDRELGVDCRFARTPEGWRCVPVEVSPLVHADAGCGSPAAPLHATLEGEECLPRPFVTEPPSGCEPVRFYRPTAGRRTLAGSFRRVPGGCVPNERVSLDALEVEEVPFARFAPATLGEVEDAPGRYARRALVGDDVRVSGPVFDRVRETECGLAGSGPARCVPPDALRVVRTGPSCGDAVAVPGECERAPPTVGLALGLESDFLCDRRTVSLFRAEAAAPAPGEICDVWRGPLPDRAWSIAPDPGVLPALRLEPVGDGRLRPLVWRGDDGTELSADEMGFWDAELGVRCAPRRFADGVDRCAPSRLPRESHHRSSPPRRFADPSCEVMAAPRLGGECAAFVVLVDDDCEARPIEYLRVGEPVERVFERRGDACVEASAVERHWRLEPVELAGLRRVVDAAP